MEGSVKEIVGGGSILRAGISPRFDLSSDGRGSVCDKHHEIYSRNVPVDKVEYWVRRTSNGRAEEVERVVSQGFRLESVRPAEDEF